VATNVILKPHPLVFRLSLPEIVGTLVRQRITDVIHLRLQQITQANGYLTDFGLRVHHGMLIVAEPENPCLNFWDADESSVRLTYGLQQNTLSLVVASYEKINTEAMADDQNPDELSTPAVKILKDVERAMFASAVTQQVDLSLEGLATNLSLESSQHVAGLNPEIWIQTVSNFTVLYNTRVGNPYQQSA
jgi:hypothetical protein